MRSDRRTVGTALCTSSRSTNLAAIAMLTRVSKRRLCENHRSSSHVNLLLGLVVVLIWASVSSSSLVEASQLNIFKNEQPWTKKVDGLPKSPQSDTIISQLVSQGGFGNGHIQMDFSINVVTAPPGTPRRAFTVNDDFWAPDCDCAAVPVPARGAVEGSDSYVCPGYADGDDCHLLIVSPSEGRLYELYRTSITSATVDGFQSGCMAVWNLNAPTYPTNLRGTDCTSADAGGFPITAMLFNADEVASGSIDHALRFILPNSRIARRVYVAPGTHSTGATSGPANAPPYGVRFRLRADYPLNTLSPGAQVIAKALQTYGMLLADGGTIALTGQSDILTANKWNDVGVDEHSLDDLKAQDFEVVDMGDKVTYTGDCVRNAQPAFAPVGVLDGDPPAKCTAGEGGGVIRTTPKPRTTSKRRTTKIRTTPKPKTTRRKQEAKKTSTLTPVRPALRKTTAKRQEERTRTKTKTKTKTLNAPEPTQTRRPETTRTRTTNAPAPPLKTIEGGSVGQIASNPELRGSVVAPTNLFVIEDDRVATLEWDTKPSPYWNFDMGRPIYANDFRNRHKFYDHTGYVVSWGIVGDATVNKIYTPMSLVMIQPLTPGVTYWAYVQSTNNNGNISVPSNTVQFQHDSTRVDNLRQTMTGFFDDFNIPAGPLDETKWNNAISLCSDINYTFPFINQQHHAHQSVSSPISCEKGLNVLRPRNTFDFTGRTGTIVFDFDATVSQTNWYLDIMSGDRIDIEGQIHIADVNNPGAPINMIRLRSNMGDDQALALLYFGTDGIMKVLKTAQLDVLGIPMIRNVRRPFVVKLSKSSIKVTVSGVTVIEASLGLPYEKATLHFTQYSYDTVAADEPFATIHWDNFGFDGPAPSVVTRNYPSYTPRMEWDQWSNYWLSHIEYSIWYPGSSKPVHLKLPDKLDGIIAARLHFTVFATYDPDKTFGPSNYITINETNIGSIPTPVEGNLPISAISTFEAGRAFIMPLDVAKVKQWAGNGNSVIRIEFNVMMSESRMRIGNIHVEVDYPGGTPLNSIVYTPPTPVFGQLTSAGNFHPVYQMRQEKVGPQQYVSEIRPGLFNWYYNAMFVAYNPQTQGLSLPLSDSLITIVGQMSCDSEMTAYGKCHPLKSVTLLADGNPIPGLAPLILPGTQTFGRWSFTFATTNLPGAAQGKTIELWPDVRNSEDTTGYTAVRLQGIHHPVYGELLGAKTGMYNPFRIYLT